MLKGAKQNRIVNASFLIAGNSEVVIPVSCVEQGRWSYRSAMFSYGDKVMPPSLRREHQKKMAENLNRGVGYRSDQGEIWENLAVKARRMSIHSETGAMSDLFEGQKDRLADYLKAFHLVDSQVGALFAINGKVMGMDALAIGSPSASFSRNRFRVMPWMRLISLKKNKQIMLRRGISGGSWKGFERLQGRAIRPW